MDRQRAPWWWRLGVRLTIAYAALWCLFGPMTPHVILTGLRGLAQAGG
jgi:hypothetical protein